MKRIISTTALSSFLIAGILIGSYGVAPAVAQPGVNALNPVNAWGINQIGRGAQSYCALSRAYDQGLVLTLGKSAKKEYSLAIDFENAGLDTGKSYKVALQPGPGQVRAYQLRPASQRALVVRLGFDDGFFKSINESKELKAQIDGQNYLFNLTDYHEGEAQLNQCMANLNDGAPMKVADAPKITVPITPQKIDSSPVTAPQAQSAAKNVIQSKIEKPVKVERAMADVASDIKPPAFMSAPIKDANLQKTVTAIETPPPVMVERTIAAPAPIIERAATTVPKVVSAPQKAVAVKNAIDNTPLPPQKVAQNTLSNVTSRNAVSKIEPASKVSTNGVVLPSSLRERPTLPSASVPSLSASSLSTPSLDFPIPSRPAPSKSVAAAVPKPEIVKSNVIESKSPAPSQPIIAFQPQSIAKPKSIITPEAIVTPDPIIVGRKEEIKKVVAPDIESKTAPSISEKKVVTPAIPKPEVIKSKKAVVASLADVEGADVAPKAPVIDASRRVSKREQIIISNAPENIPRNKPRLWNQTVEKKQQDELVRIKEENKRLNEALRAETKKPERTAIAPPTVTSMPTAVPVKPVPAIQAPKADPAEVKSLRAQIAKLEAQIKEKSEVKPFVSPEMTAEIAMLRAENKKLVSSLGAQEKKMDSFDALSPKAEKELEKMRMEIANLRADNERLAQERKKANSQIDGARVDAGNVAFDKIRMFEKQLELAKADNLTLSREIESMREAQNNIGAKSKTNNSSGDWDLEKATHRYNEAEREIRRLGMLLEQQRTGHRAEKVQLEQMLFDPAVTDKQQRRRLVELESKLLAAEKQLEAMGRARAQDRYDGSLARLDVAGISPAPRVISNTAPNASPSVTPKVAPRMPAPQKLSTAMAAPPAPVIREALTPAPVAVPQIRVQPPVVQDRPAPIQVVRKEPVDLRNLLRQAGVQSSSISAAPNGQYRWQAGNIAGTAQIVPTQRGGSIDQFVQQYISTAKKRCQGDFASSETPRANAARRTYDIVCVDGSTNTASSVIFAAKDQNLLAIAHSTNTDNLDLAIDLRDRIADRL